VSGPGMTFGVALEALKDGHRIARQGWSGKNMWLMYVDGTGGLEARPGTPYHTAIALGDKTRTVVVNIKGHIDMMCADGEMQPGWLASQQDLLAHDWELI
jgi:hypothetical protein